MHEQYDTIIIGGGVSAFGAALYAGRFAMKTLVIGKELGGTINLTDTVENYPGFKKIVGMELADKIRNHAKEYGIDIIEEEVTKIEKCGDNCYTVFVKDKKYHAKTIIIATGTKVRKLGVPGEKEFTNKGVHYCALCDGPMYKDKTIGVVGGSDSAAKEALLLSQYGKKVYIIYRKEKIRAEPVNLERIKENKKIEIIPNTNVVEIKGEKFMDKVLLDREYNGKKKLALDAVFIEIGHIPLSELAKSIGVQLNKKNEIMIDRESKTNVPGIFSAGDVTDTKFKQAITGVAEGVTAAYTAYQYIGENNIVCPCDDED